MTSRRVLGSTMAAATLAAVVGVAAGGERHAGTVLAVDPHAGSLVLDEFGANGDRHALRVRVPPGALVLLSQRNPSAREVEEAFRDRTMTLADVRTGDFVVVELSGDSDLAQLVVITLRRGAGS